ncbi:MAG: hypothetical protein R3327_03525 [Nitrosopumilaceae archaeon]|nr:hypothetical protein [Nitrosopumilaceae archaeon]
MELEEKIDDCEFNLRQLQHFEPDPHYTKYFFNEFLKSVDKFYQNIFQEANRDFGLFVKGDCNREKFIKKAKEKNDSKALKFVTWFDKKFDDIHVNIFPNFIKKILKDNTKNNSFDIKIMLRAKGRYKDDTYQEIKVPLSNGKIRSKEELKIEIRRQLPVFLEIINHKRESNNEPKLEENDVVASVFADMHEYQNMEIAYACEVYLPVMKEFLKEGREQIKKLTQFA